MEITTQFLTLVPVVLGVVQVFKVLGLSTRFLPLLSVILGTLATILLGRSITGLVVIQGIVIGLSACGLWSGTKNAFESISVKFGKK